MRGSPRHAFADARELPLRLTFTLVLVASGLGSCMTLSPNSDPLNVSVAGVEPLDGEGLELRLAVKIRIQNPNDTPVDYAVHGKLEGGLFGTTRFSDTGTFEIPTSAAGPN